MGLAARLWLWMWCYQSEQGRKRKKRRNEFVPSDGGFAKLWGVNEKTVKEQRKKLEKLGYLRREVGGWKVYANPKKEGVYDTPPNSL